MGRGAASHLQMLRNALDVALDEEIRQIPVNQRKQNTCLLLGAGGTGKTTIILQLLLPIFLQYFPAVDGEDRYAILTFSHAQGDAISNETFRAITGCSLLWSFSGICSGMT